MDYGYWIRLFQTHYLRAKGLFGYYMISWTITTKYSQVIYWNYFQLWMFITWRWSYILEVDLISTGRYHDDVDVNQWNSHMLDLLHTSHVTKTITSSDVAISDVCIYSGTRFAPIHVPNYASSVCMTIFFLWHMCVMFYIVACCNMLLCIVCYCVNVCISTL